MEQNLRQQPIRELPYLSANGKPELCIFRRGDWPTALSIKTYDDGQSTLTFKRGKIVVSFTLDGVDYLGDYHVKNVIFGRPPFCVVLAVLRSMFYIRLLFKTIFW